MVHEDTCVPSSTTTVSHIALQTVQPVHGATCPGGDVVFVCNITSRTVFAWRYPLNITAAAIFFNNELPANKTLNDFVIAAHIETPNDFIYSTASLTGALLSHNNIVLQCWAPGLAKNGTVTIAGSYKQ